MTAKIGVTLLWWREARHGRAVDDAYRPPHYSTAIEEATQVRVAEDEGQREDKTACGSKEGTSYGGTNNACCTASFTAAFPSSSQCGLRQLIDKAAKDGGNLLD